MEPIDLCADGKNNGDLHACQASAAGCTRCHSVPSDGDDRAALLLGAQDNNSDETLRQALVEANIAFSRLGPLMVIADARSQLAELGGVLKSKLSSYTRDCIRAAYAPAGAATLEQALAAFIFAESLNSMLSNSEHEWVRDALTGEWLFSVFHPIINARSGQLFAQECLIRARDPQSGNNYGAGQIITACEKLNLEHQLDQRARQAAIRGGAKFVTDESVRLFINFLPNTIYDPQICLRTTMETAAECKVNIRRLVFEVVETEKIEDMKHLARILNYYRERGVGTAVDDMGAGFTSVEYINALTPDFVKLDRDLVVKAETDAAARKSIDMVVQATHAIGAEVIAEGIETPAQHVLATNAGCDFVQGFLFCKPSCPPVSEVVNFPARRVA